MNTVSIFLAGACSLYLVAGLSAAVAAYRREEAPPLEDNLPTASILVAARNEEEALPDCLEALAAQKYPPEALEILVADDRSTDDTASLIKEREQVDERFRYVRVPSSTDGELVGKPHALHQAFQEASGEILLVTDADCTPPPQWARHLASRFQQSQRGVVCGVTLVRYRRLLDRIQSLDWMLLLTVAAAAARFGRPITAMGNNMAFRRQAYEAVGGYPGLDFSVTEDYALFRAVHETTPWTVHLLLDRNLRNFTAPLPSLGAIFRQRRRWARGGLRARLWIYLLYLAIFGTHLLLLGGLVVAPLWTLPLLVVKMVTDFVVLAAGSRCLDWRAPFRSFLLFEIYLFGYVLLMPFALLLMPQIRWKGRRF